VGKEGNMVNKILEYLKSGFPIIQLRTLEYDRAEEIIKEVYEEYQKLQSDCVLLKWDGRDGLSIYGEIGDESLTRRPEFDAAIDFISNNIKNKCIAIFRNLDELYSDGFRIPSPDHYEHIYKFYKRGQAEGKHIVIVGNKTLTPEIADYVAVIDLPLPDEKEIERITKVFYENVLMDKPSKKVIEDIIRVSKGMNSMQLFNALSMATERRNNKYVVNTDVLMEEKANIVKKSNLLEWVKVEETIDDVGGLSNIKDWFFKIAKAYKDYERALKYGLPMMKGTLIIGVSGTGKTLIAKVIANLFGVPLFRLDVGRLFNSLVGDTERNVRELFKLEDAVAPCVILVDEVEKAFAGAKTSLDSGVTARMVGAFLYRLQEKTTNSFYVCTANDINMLPPELLRKGRFDEIWYVSLPSEEEVEEILKIHLRKTGRPVENFDIPAIAHHMTRFTGAEVEGCVRQAMYNAFYEDREFTTEDIINVAKATVPLAETKKDEIRELEEWAKNRVRFASDRDHKEIWAGVSKRTIKK